MNIENEVFEKAIVNYKKLKEYGFIPKDNVYTYSKLFMNNAFWAIINVGQDGKVFGKIIDNETKEEYLNYKITGLAGTYSKEVREEYKEILRDICNKCFDKKYFKYDQANRVADYIINKYQVYPEFLWEKYDDFGVFKNKKNNKWFVLIANVDFSKLDNENGEVEIINVKCDSKKLDDFLTKKGFYKAYHMNKKSWITVVLNDTIEDVKVFKLIDDSYNEINKN